jgi:1-acyl-sn-glycerol-3-phosphate acyltransferase
MVQFLKSTKPNEFISEGSSYWHEMFFGFYVKLSIYFHFNSVSLIKIDENNSIDNLRVYPFFSFSSKPKVSKPSNRPLLLLCNHYSWWDGLLVYVWNKHYVGKKFKVMTLRKTLIFNRTLNYIGGYSVNPGHRSVLKSLQYTLQLLENPKNLVLIFPQGEISSNHIEKVKFQPGIKRIYDQINEEVEIVFMAGFIDYFGKRKPDIKLYVSTFIGVKGMINLEEEYNRFYKFTRNIQATRTE